MNRCEMEASAGEALGNGLGRNQGVEYLTLSRHSLVKSLAKGIITLTKLKYLDAGTNKVGEEGGVELTKTLQAP